MNDEYSFTQRNHILGHKTKLNKFKRTKIIQSMFSNYKKIRLEIINRKVYENSFKYLGFKHTLISNLWVKEEIQRTLKNILSWIKIKTQHTDLWDVAKGVSKEIFIALDVYIAIILWIKWNIITLKRKISLVFNFSHSADNQVIDKNPFLSWYYSHSRYLRNI